MMAKGQVAMEFLAMIGIAIIFTLVLASIFFILSNDYSEKRNVNELRDLGYSLQNEVILASQVEPGYIREIIIPTMVGDADFAISQTQNDLVINYKGADMLFPIPPVSGSFSKGKNTIKKDDAGSIIIS
jgi:hypothetical protein